jgi:phospholipid/cholesterol/gamma-HCH transport system ATP-binding protein
MIASYEFAVRVHDLGKTFDGKDYVLDGINLEIPKGEITVLIGFSGTGKSVLLKHILGLVKPSRGFVEILGHNYSSMDDREITSFRKNFGVLFQNAALFDDLNVIDNVSFPIHEHRRKELSLSEIYEIASTRLKLVGLDEKHFKKLPAELSGGMRKRVGLARAIALDPEILLYDEPTTGLDPIMTEMVDNLIQSTHKHREGLTSVIVSHDLFSAFRIGDNVAMLDSGRILLYGTPKDFMKSDIELVRRFIDKGVNR